MGNFSGKALLGLHVLCFFVVVESKHKVGCTTNTECNVAGTVCDKVSFTCVLSAVPITDQSSPDDFTETGEDVEDMDDLESEIGLLEEEDWFTLSGESKESIQSELDELRSAYYEAKDAQDECLLDESQLATVNFRSKSSHTWSWPFSAKKNDDGTTDRPARTDGTLEPINGVMTEDGFLEPKTGPSVLQNEEATQLMKDMQATLGNPEMLARMKNENFQGLMLLDDTWKSFWNPDVYAFHRKLFDDADPKNVGQPFPVGSAAWNIPKKRIYKILSIMKAGIYKGFDFNEANLIYHLLHHNILKVKNKVKLMEALAGLTLFQYRIKNLRCYTKEDKFFEYLRGQKPSTLFGYVGKLTYEIAKESGALQPVYQGMYESVKSALHLVESMPGVSETLFVLDVIEISSPALITARHAFLEAWDFIVDAKTQANIHFDDKLVDTSSLKINVQFDVKVLAQTNKDILDKRVTDELTNFLNQQASQVAGVLECTSNDDCWEKHKIDKDGLYVCNNVPSSAKVGQRADNLYFKRHCYGGGCKCVPCSTYSTGCFRCSFYFTCSKKSWGYAVEVVYQKVKYGGNSHVGDNTCGERRRIGQFCQKDSDCLTNKCFNGFIGAFYNDKYCVCNTSPLTEMGAKRMEIELKDMLEPKGKWSEEYIGQWNDLVDAIGCEKNSILPASLPDDKGVQKIVAKLPTSSSAAFMWIAKSVVGKKWSWTRPVSDYTYVIPDDSYRCMANAESFAGPVCYSPPTNHDAKDGALCHASYECESKCCKARISAYNFGSNGYNHCSPHKDNYLFGFRVRGLCLWEDLPPPPPVVEGSSTSSDDDALPQPAVAGCPCPPVSSTIDVPPPLPPPVESEDGGGVVSDRPLLSKGGAFRNPKKLSPPPPLPPVISPLVQSNVVGGVVSVDTTPKPLFKEHFVKVKAAEHKKVGGKKQEFHDSSKLRFNQIKKKGK